ncbi:DUF2637 domain-containing protein [Nocardia sp. CDC160]|uniref:DUF2637 domain-containing protein n=1 Tax=Nocardia sp. CDC160 TaxID=3112166 RepID=UPI002DB7234F|nr:DUF2637 domain-containing protein [Nocardia sp. CDC160]MEC3918413.1 DUF2637 domain-containing protein [Nocardia sp. CDC160]MEC3919150.1 DUF2637 domain-containing protein [Nocardia sp. CDC160]
MPTTTTYSPEPSDTCTAPTPPTHQTAPPNQRAHTSFFWCVLLTAATVSITGNATHAVLHAHALPAIAAAVAIVPPIALLAAVHGVTVLLRAHAHARWMHLLATVMTVLIAVAAFRLSFTALRDLAALAAIPQPEAWLWPVIIEGSMTQATVALLALAHTGSTRAHATAGQQLEEGVTQNSRAESPRAHDDSATNHETANGRTPLHSNPSPQRWSSLANALCDRDPAHRRAPADVAIVLSKHFDQGRTATEISRETGRSRSTISRIIGDATRIRAGEGHGCESIPIPHP